MREDARGRAHLERAAERFARQVAEPAEAAEETPNDANVAYVRYQGLTMRSDLNGSRAQLLRHDEVRNRWQTKALDGKVYWVKPENFHREDDQVPTVSAEAEADWPPGEHLDDGGDEEEARGRGNYEVSAPKRRRVQPPEDSMPDADAPANPVPEAGVVDILRVVDILVLKQEGEEGHNTP